MPIFSLYFMARFHALRMCERQKNGGVQFGLAFILRGEIHLICELVCTLLV